MCGLFDTTVNRARWGSYKWNPERNGGADVLPFHVADMDFPAPPCVCDTLRETADYGCFGYTDVLSSYSEALISWCMRRYGVSCKAEWIMFADSSTSLMLNAVRCLARQNNAEYLIALEPGYAAYPSFARQTGLYYYPCPLRHRMSGDPYTVDLDTLEETLHLHSPAVLLICNPHNPTGHVWTPIELDAVEAMCMRTNARVISDEVFADFTSPHHTYSPYFSRTQSSEAPSLTVLSPTKAFNLSGLKISCAITKSVSLLDALRDEYARVGFHEPNMLALIASQAAWKGADDWIDQLNIYVETNRDIVARALRQQGIEPAPMEGTYLQWLSYLETGLDEETFLRRCKEERILISPGSHFGKDEDRCFRLSLASPHDMVEEGMVRLARVFA